MLIPSCEITTKLMPKFPSKFLRILQRLSPHELKSFEAWLRSPWCNSNKNLLRLLASLRPYHPDFSCPQLSKENLFRQVLPKGKFSERRMNNLLSEAYLAAERFLVFQRLAKAPDAQQNLLVQAFQERGLEDWFFKSSAQQLEQLEAKPVKSHTEHLALFDLYQRLYQHPQPEAKVQEAHTWLEKMDTHLDLFYLLEKAAIINEMIFRSRLYREVSYDLSSEVKKWQQAVAGLQHPALDLYQMRFAYTDQELLPQYLELKTALLQRFDELSSKEQITQLLSLINDAKMLIKAGILDITESLPLYQLGLSSGAILSQGKISTNTYMTIVSASNTKGSFDFTSYFMDTYTPCLPAEAQNDCAHWAKAHTAYWQKDLQACLAILQMYPFEALQFQLTGRVLCTQAHFDLYLSDPSYQFYLLNYLDAFEKWLSRDKIWAKPNTITFLRFVQACRTLVRYHSDPKPNAQKIEKLLGNDGNIQALNWLKQKTSAVLNLKRKWPFKN